MHNAGIEVSDHQPEHGFTMIVKSGALLKQRVEISGQEIEVTKRSPRNSQVSLTWIDAALLWNRRSAGKPIGKVKSSP